MELSRFRIPLNDTGLEIVVEIKDAKARAELADIAQHISGYMSYLGETATPISSGSSINPIEINGKDVTAIAGSVVSSRGGIFLFNGNVWREFGSVGALKALAYKDEVEAEYTPEGTITKPVFIGTKAEMSATIVPRGRIDITQEDPEDGEANFVAEGTVTAPNITVTPQTARIHALTNAGRLPTCEFPNITMELDGEGLLFGWQEGSFDPGSSGSTGEEITVVTGIAETKASEPRFVGKPKKLSGSFVGQGSQVELEYTPEGNITTPRFEGTPVTITSK